MDLAALQQELAALEQCGDYGALLSRAAAACPLLHGKPQQQAWLTYLIGKAHIALGRFAEALLPLQRCLALQPDHAHAHYLLGYALARQQQWLSALLALQRSCGLGPLLPDAWFEQGRVVLELGDCAAARPALERALQLRPDWPAAQGLLHAARVQLAMQQGVEPGAQALAAALTAAAPAWLVQQGVELAAALLLAGQHPQAQRLLEALATPCPTVQACSDPWPRRLVLALRLGLVVLHDRSALEQGQALADALRSLLWMPLSAVEQQLWPRVQPHLLAMLQAVQSETDGAQVARWIALILRAVPMPTSSEPKPGPDSALTPQHRRDIQLQQLSEQMLDLPARLVVLPGFEDEALALRQQHLQSLLEGEAQLAGLDQMAPAPMPRRPRRHWLLLASRDLTQCVIYRVEQKRQQLERLGCSVRILWREQLDDWSFSLDLLWADAVVVCRLAATHSVLRAMATARRFGCSLYYDIDDLIFDADHCPPSLASYGGTLSPAVHRRFRLDVPLYLAAMQQADAVIVSTATLARRWQELNPGSTQPVMILPNLAPPELWCLASQCQQELQPESQGPAGLRLVFASGTTAHKQAWQQELAPALVRLLEANPRLQLDLLGHVQLPPPLLTYGDRVRCRPFMGYGSYLRLLRQAAIGVVVLEPGIFTDAKSAIRWMEFSLLGLASVLSPTATYTELLEPGRDALFARGTEAWCRTIQRLIDDPAQRCSLAATAQAKAAALFNPEQADHFWGPLLAAPVPAVASERRRLLVINVFFAPQSVGGATRVAQDQVRQLLERAGDRYEVTVLCADHRPWRLPPSAPEDVSEDPQHSTIDAAVAAVDCHGWHGARVVRLSLPLRDWQDHHDPVVADFCRQWFADEGFDLIHAHCLQQLTAAPLLVAAELGIPYLVTLHDGWWLSPSLFLTSISGRPINPADPIDHHDDLAAQPPQQLDRDRQRRRDLLQLLERAQARLAVSPAFAELYAQSGVCDVDVLANDWQAMPAASRRRSAGEPLRLCYVGGLSLHKGFAVLQAALLRYRLADCGAGAQLTVIDATLEPHERYTLNWNGTTVRARPSVPMAEMAAFYAEHDVLIAPSIWPESYGLVTREALSAGLWVVASGIGALADPIEPGVNGHVLPPGDADALGQTLQALAQTHPTPRARPAWARFERQQQAIDQLLPLYDRL